LFFGYSHICPLYLCSLQGKSQIVQDELVRLGEQMVQSAEGTRAIALELCREFEDKFLQHIMTGEVSRQISYVLMLYL
jgi:dynamin GTPase